MFRKLVFLSSFIVVSLTIHGQENNEAVVNTSDNAKKSHVQTLTFEMGPSWVTSKMYFPNGKKYTWRTGLEIGAEYTCVFSKGYGFGITFMHNRTDYPMDAVKLNFIGPSFVYAGNFSEKWRGKVSFGVGFSNFADEYEKQSGVGTRYAAGVEHVVTKHFGIGATLQTMTLYLGKNDDNYPGDSDDYKGVSRFGVNLTAHYYF